MIFEQLIQTCEQVHHEDRANYGDQLLAALARDFKSKNIKGLSKRNLHYFSQFYLMYPNVGQLIANMKLPESIVQTLSAQSEIMQQKNDYIEVA